MHASIDQLLKLRDDETADVAAAQHLITCRQCYAQLEQLRAVTRGLRALPDRWTPPDRWSAIREALTRPRQAAVERRARPGWLLPAASAAAVVMAVVFTLDTERQVSTPASNTPSVATAPQQTVPDERLALIDESQRLQEVLDTLPGQPRIVRGSTALTVADLEDRIQVVDYRLTNGSDSGLSARQSQQLWRERVDLLNSLVAVRYAETRTPSF